MKYIILTISILVILVCAFMYWFIYVVGGMDIKQFVNFYRYGVVNPVSFIGMTREEVFKWAENNRVVVSDVDTTRGKIAIGWTREVDFFHTVEEFNNYGDRSDDKVNNFLTTDTLSVNYYSAYGTRGWDILTLKDNKVVNQGIGGYSEGIGLYQLFPDRFKEYDEMVKKNEL